MKRSLLRCLCGGWGWANADFYNVVIDQPHTLKQYEYMLLENQLHVIDTSEPARLSLESLQNFSAAGTTQNLVMWRPMKMVDVEASWWNYKGINFLNASAFGLVLMLQTFHGEHTNYTHEAYWKIWLLAPVLSSTFPRVYTVLALQWNPRGLKRTGLRSLGHGINMNKLLFKSASFPH